MMPKNVLKRAMSAEVLNHSWKKLKRQHTPWSPTVSREELDWNLLQHILHMREAVLSARYRPLPLRRYALKKTDGKQRIITAQYLQDKLLQRAILSVLEPDAEQLFHEDSFGYRPHRGVHTAIQRVNERVKCGQDWLVDADIKSFFDSIPHRLLRQFLRRFIADKTTLKLIDLWLKQGAHFTSLLGARQGISQGAVLSPLLCNLYLHQLDEKFSKANIPFVRFADDFLLFCPNQQAAFEALAYTKKQLDSLGLSLHPKKTRVIRSHRRYCFLGKALPMPSR